MSADVVNAPPSPAQLAGASPSVGPPGGRRIPLHAERLIRAAAEAASASRCWSRPTRRTSCWSLRAAGGGLSILVRTFERPMGLAVRRPAAGGRHPRPGLGLPQRAGRRPAASSRPAGTTPASCPRSSHVTGDIGVHEMAWARRRAVARQHPLLLPVHARRRTTASCRAGGRRSSRALAAEDRCHLNGLAMVDGQPRYVTALGETDTPGGWRANKAQRRLPDRRGQRRGRRRGPVACRTRRAGTTAGCGCWNPGTGRLVRRRPGDRRPRDASPSCPASRAGWRCRALRLRRPVEDPRDVGDGRRPDRRARARS